MCVANMFHTNISGNFGPGYKGTIRANTHSSTPKKTKQKKKKTQKTEIWKEVFQFLIVLNLESIPLHYLISKCRDFLSSPVSTSAKINNVKKTHTIYTKCIHFDII